MFTFFSTIPEVKLLLIIVRINIPRVGKTFLTRTKGELMATNWTPAPLKRRE